MFRQLFLPVVIAMFGALSLGMRTDAQSVHPFYEKDDVVFRQELIGKLEVERVPIEFSAVGENTYGVRVQADARNQFCFLAHLFRVDGRYFLVTWPSSRNGKFLTRKTMRTEFCCSETGARCESL